MMNELYKDLPIGLLQRLGWPLNWVELGDDQKALIEAVAGVQDGEIAELKEQIEELKKEIEDCDDC